MALAIGTVWASYDGTIDSVHFYNSASGPSVVDFGQLPQQMMANGWNNLPRRAGTDGSEDFAPDAASGNVGPANALNPYWLRWTNYRDFDSESDPAKRTRQRIAEARNAEVQGDLRKAIRLYFESEADAKRFIRSRSELLRVSNGQNGPALQRYLRATYLEQFHGDTADSELEKLSKEAIPAYLRKFMEDRLPDPSIEPGFTHAKQLLHVPSNAKDAPQAARELRSILAEHPRTKKKGDIFGWLARSEYLQGHFDLALDLYRKQLALSPSTEREWTAKHSMYIVYGAKGLADKQIEMILGEWLACPDAERHLTAGKLLRAAFDHLSASQAKSLHRYLRGDSRMLAGYLGFRIEDTALTPRQERGLYQFAYSALEQTTDRPPLLVLRTAQASYNAGLYNNALKLASLVAGRTSLPKEIRQRAQFVTAGSLARLGRPRLAINQYKALLKSDVRHYLKVSAQEHLALLEERYGDPLSALEIYGDLGYEWDYAYLADAKLSPAQLETAVRRAKFGERKDVLKYTLGMRYLRLERYSEAERVWRAMPSETRSHFGLTATHYVAFKKTYGQGNDFDDFPALPDPLLTTQKLLRWQRGAHNGTSESRAKSLYLAASYIYDHKCLLFYSPALWNFDRTFALGTENWSASSNDARDVSARYRHMYDHECYSQALRYCKRIVADFPHSSVMPKALYTGAISSEHLVHMSEYWRNTDRIDHLKLAADYLDQVVRNYPHDPLVRMASKYAKVFRSELVQKDWGSS